MRWIRATICFLVVSCLFGCATGPSKGTAQSSSQPMRYLAWLEGSYQTSYRADRQKVLKRLAELKGTPETDKDKYLEYLSLLDAAGRLRESGTKIRSFLQKNPKETRAAFLLGVHHLRRGKRGLAKYFFERLEKDDRFPWKSLLFNNLGMMALKRGDRFRAINYFEKATSTKPPIAAPFVNLGALYLQSESYADAEKAFSKALSLDDDFEDAALGRGAALEALGQFGQANDVYSDFLKGHPKAVSVLYNNGILLGKRLKRNADGAKMLLRYVQAGGKETAKAQELIQKWR